MTITSLLPLPPVLPLTPSLYTLVLPFPLMLDMVLLSQDMEAVMASVKQNSSSTIAGLQAQMSGFATRISDLEQLKTQQEGTIRTQREEWTAATSTIKVT